MAGRPKSTMPLPWSCGAGVLRHRHVALRLYTFVDQTSCLSARVRRRSFSALAPESHASERSREESLGAQVPSESDLEESGGIGMEREDIGDLTARQDLT